MALRRPQNPVSMRSSRWASRRRLFSEAPIEHESTYPIVDRPLRRDPPRPHFCPANLQNRYASERWSLPEPQRLPSTRRSPDRPHFRPLQNDNNREQCTLPEPRRLPSTRLLPSKPRSQCPIDTRTLAAPSYKIILGASSSDVDLAFAVGVASERFKQFASTMEVRTPQGCVVSREQLEGAPVPQLPPSRDLQQSRAQKITWAQAECRRAAREHAVAERERIVEHELRFETAWRSVAQTCAPAMGLSCPDQLWDDVDDDEGEAQEELAACEAYCGCLAEQIYAVLRAICGSHWRCLRSAAERRRAEKELARQVLARYTDWKSTRMRMV